VGSKKPRQCGECIACCVHLPFEGEGEVEGKTGHVRCSKLKEGCQGCSIYDTRPQFCRSYMCQWILRDPLLSYRMRPDKCKILVHMKHDELGGNPGIAITEIEEGAFHKDENKKIIRKIMLQKRWSSVVLVAYSGEELVYSNNQSQLVQLSNHLDTNRPVRKT